MPNPNLDRRRVPNIEISFAAPTSGTYSAGDICINGSPVTTTGQFGWACVLSGTPGTWISLGSVTDAAQTIAGAKTLSGALTLSDSLTVPTTDGSGTPGNATIDKMSGKSAIAQSASAVTITCDKCAATSRVFITPLDTDETLVTWKAVPGSGSFVVTGGAAAAAAWKFSWIVIN